MSCALRQAWQSALLAVGTRLTGAERAWPSSAACAPGEPRRLTSFVATLLFVASSHGNVRGIAGERRAKRAMRRSFRSRLLDEDQRGRAAFRTRIGSSFRAEATMSLGLLTLLGILIAVSIVGAFVRADGRLHWHKSVSVPKSFS